MASRALALSLPCLLLVGGCLKAPARVKRGCVTCHSPHHARDGSCTECHRGDGNAARRELAHARLLTGRAAEHRLADGPALREGKWLVEMLSCRRCHRVGGEGNRLAADLDAVVWKREQSELAPSILRPVENMPDFGLDRRQAEAVIAFLLRKGSPARAQGTYRVSFARGVTANSTVFDWRCGGCHRALGPKGPIGRGDQGPNLSGLFTPFYPRTATGGRVWTTQDFASWLQNPRSARATTTMPPVALTADELRQVTAELGG